MAIDDRKPAVDGSGGLDLDARWHLELPAVVRGDQHQELMASFGQPKQGHRAGKPAMVGIRILAASLGDIRAEHAVIDAPAGLSVDEGLDSLDARGSQDPAGDDDGFPRDEDRTAVGLVEATDDPTRFEGMIVDLERRRELGLRPIGCGDADGRLVHAVGQIADADLAREIRSLAPAGNPG